MKLGVYKITNPNGEFYIGQSRNIDKRMRSHAFTLGTNESLKKSFNDFGFEGHEIEIIEECEIEKLIDRERFYISTLNPVLNGLVGAPKKAPTFKPSLRCEVALWKSLQAKYPGKLNRMFNEWLKTL